MKIKKLVGLLACILIASGIAFAHHGSGLSYQMDKEATIKGTVVNFRWANPHSQLYFDVGNGNDVVHWAVEMGSPGVLSRMGVWQRNTLKPGDTVTITYHPSKSGEPVGHCITMIQPNGHRVGCYAETITDDDKTSTTSSKQPAQ